MRVVSHLSLDELLFFLCHVNFQIYANLLLYECLANVLLYYTFTYTDIFPLIFARY